MSTQRLEAIRKIELNVQKDWAEGKVYESDVSEKEKFYVTFPYPYMNGRLHLGHAFSLTKAEFTSRYQRLQGKNVLFPFSFHCTGMPIAASADMIKNELAALAAGESLTSAAKQPDGAIQAGTKAKKSKVLAKEGNARTQMDILRQLNVPEDEIPKFSDPVHWLTYFPPIGMADLSSFGLSVDWRRSFITTAYNQYYDRFIKWQFTLLKERNRIKFGLRPAVFSKIEHQPCADHDRRDGEGVGPTEYLMMKYEISDSVLISGVRTLLSDAGVGNLPVYLLAALAPVNGNLYAKSNFVTHPDTEFGLYLGQITRITPGGCEGADDFVAYANCDMNAVRSSAECIYICSEKCAYNLAYQGYLRVSDRKPVSVGTLVGTEISQLTIHTGDDRIPELTGIAADKLRDVRGSGILITSPADQPDEIAKGALVKKIIESKEGFDYFETEKPVVSRSHDVCVVALCNQWYSDFGDASWKSLVLDHVLDPKSFDSCGQLAAYERTVNWIDGWACSRNYGLGTCIPWEEEKNNHVVIESLSDSTIYFAYYTIAHFLQGDIYGKVPGIMKILPEQLTRAAFDFIFCQTDSVPECEISVANLKTLRATFEYYYPMNLRCSGKDLLQNHLTMSLFHHAAIWPTARHLWPRCYYFNGHLLLDSAKMSKSTGNFLTIRDAIDKFGADTTRLTLADAGDSSDDANFEQTTAIASMMKLYNFLQVAEEICTGSGFRAGDKHEIDKLFEAQIYNLIGRAKIAYSGMIFRDALKYSFYEAISLYDTFKPLASAFQGLHVDSLKLWIRLIAIALSPIAPHCCEHIWKNLLQQDGFVANAEWPCCPFTDSEFAEQKLRYFMLTDVVAECRKQLDSARKPRKNAAAPHITCIKVKVAMTYDYERIVILNILKSLDYAPQTMTLYDPKILATKLRNSEELKLSLASDKKAISRFMAFANYKLRAYPEQKDLAFAHQLPFDEVEFYKHHSSFLEKAIGLPITFEYTESAEASPACPMFQFL